MVCVQLGTSLPFLNVPGLRRTPPLLSHLWAPSPVIWPPWAFTVWSVSGYNSVCLAWLLGEFQIRFTKPLAHSRRAVVKGWLQ